MPAEPHLVPILERLGDGGTTALAQTVHTMITEAVAAAVPPDVAELQHDLTEIRRSYENACKTIADMHAAAVGEVRGPIRGVVEDVADLRTAFLTAERRFDRALSKLNEIGGPDAVTDAYAANIHDMIAASSLGTPEAVAARATVTDKEARAAVARAAELADEDPDDDIVWGDDPTDPAPEPAEDDTPPAPPAARPDPSPDEIRAWCRTQTPPVPVSAKGPIGKIARRAYDDAHPTREA